MDFSLSESRKLPRFHRCFKGWRRPTLERTRRAMPAPVWEGIAAQLTLLNQYVRPSELLALRKNDLLPPLVPLLPCWSIVTAASEAGAPTKTRICYGSVFMDQRWLNLVNKLLAVYQTCHRGASIDRVRGFRTLQESAKNFQQWLGTLRDKLKTLARPVQDSC